MEINIILFPLSLTSSQSKIDEKSKEQGVCRDDK
jgi:hypothetical protein